MMAESVNNSLSNDSGPAGIKTSAGEVVIPKVPLASSIASKRPLACSEAISLGSIAQAPSGSRINLTISNGEIRPGNTVSSQPLQSSLAKIAVNRDLRSTENSAASGLPKPIIVTVSGIAGASPFNRTQLTGVTTVSPGPVLAGSMQAALPVPTSLSLSKLATCSTTPCGNMSFITSPARPVNSVANFTPTGITVTNSSMLTPNVLPKPPAILNSCVPTLPSLVPVSSVSGALPIVQAPLVFAATQVAEMGPLKPQATADGAVTISASMNPVMNSNDLGMSLASVSQMSTNTTTSPSSKPHVVSKVTVPVQTDESGDASSIAPHEKSTSTTLQTQTDSDLSGDANPSTLDPTSPDYDPIQALDWKEGIATLPGSNIKFRLNEFGTLEVLDTEETKALLGKAKKEKDGKTQETNSETAANLSIESSSSEAPAKATGKTAQDTKAEGKQDISKCENCNSHGLSAEFVQGRFCCQHCFQIYTNKKAALKKHKEILLLKKKRKRLGLHYVSSVEAPSKEIKYTVKDKSDKNSVKLVMNAKLVSKPKTFSWSSYLEEQKAISAPTSLFKENQLFPTTKNGFKPQMKLEGIDPRHPSMFCVLTVTETCGHRIRLHFDGYSDCYDFWVNADSADIFPVSWCEKTGHKLHPPKGYTAQSFHWPSYLRQCKAQAAPKHLFSCRNSQHVTPHGFRIGMKLEAVDKKNTSLVCVATVADVMDNRFLVHFDGWDDIYDYWADPTSPYIHPVNWCFDTGHVLTPPNNYKHPESFTWEKYLAETKTQAVPARAFKQRPPHGFKVGMKLEAVDRRNPKLIRVATIAEIDSHMVKIHFDGWSSDYDYWIDNDSPDLHPISWCSKTRHPLEPPIDLPSHPVESGCPTPGCKGVGHIKGPKYTSHHSAFGCPYSPANMNKDTTLQDRLGPLRESGSESAVKNETAAVASEPLRKNNNVESTQSNQGKSKAGYRMAVERYLGKGGSQNIANGDDSYPPPKRKRGRTAIPESDDKESRSEDGESTRSSSQYSLQDSIHQSVFVGNPIPNPSREMPLCWDHHAKLLPGVNRIKGNTVAKWSIDDVANFIDTIPGCQDQSRLFKEEQIDGEAFLLLNQTDIVKILSIKLGPALKIYNSILMFRSTLTD